MQKECIAGRVGGGIEIGVVSWVIVDSSWNSTSKQLICILATIRIV